MKAKIDFYTTKKTEKVAVFEAIASTMGMTPFAVEKDWWVSRTLEIIFQMDIAKHLVFKGGTLYILMYFNIYVQKRLILAN